MKPYYLSNLLKAVFTAVFCLTIISLFQPVFAATSSLTSRNDFDSGTYNQTEGASRSGELRLEAAGSFTTRVWKTPSVALGDQSSVVSDGTYLYIKVAGDNNFQRYDPVKNTWKDLANAPRYSYAGSDMKVLNGAIYATFGGYQYEFYKYTIATNTWTKLANMPDLMNAGGSIGTDGTNIYAIRGTATTDFWKYTVSTNTWSTLTSPPATISTGGSLIYSGGYFYTPRGGNTTTFYRYSVSGGTWSTMAAAPAAFNSDGNITVHGDYIYALRGSSTNSFYRYSISGDSWTSMTNTPQTTGYVGLIYHSGDGYIYVFRGNNTQEMWKYDIGNDAFVGMNDLPNTPGTGSDLINYRGSLYYVRGNGSTNFYKYDLSSGSWSGLLAAFPGTMADDVKGASAGAYLYFVRGSSTTTFYRYDPTGDSFTTLAVSPATLGGGSAVVYPGSGDYLYVTRGLNTQTFYRYSISGNTWDDAGASDLPTNAAAGIGSRMISDGTNIYYLSGNGTSRLLKYNISGNSWTWINNTPFSTYYGTDINYYKGKLYIQAGYYKQDFWEYNPTTNTWRRLPDMQSNFAYDQGPYNGAALASDGGGNLYSTLGALSLWWRRYSIGTTNYPTTGTWVSDVMDLTYVSSWTSLTASTTTPGDSSVTFETRSSANRTSWTSWQSVSGGIISSTAQRYLQVRATLHASTDQSITPVLSDVTVTYAGDTTAPTNPSSFSAKSTSGGTTLTSGTTYSYTNPYFNWSGASDAQTSISGYYVYFGTSSSGDPVTNGTLQTASTYTVTTPLANNTYYLRLATVDASNNVSSAVTEFTYVYSGLTSTSITKTLTSDFVGGVENSVSIQNNEIKLASKSGFWQQNRLSMPPGTISSGAGWAYDSPSNNLFTFRGASTTTFYEYDIDTDTWFTKAVAPATVTTGGTMAGGNNGYIYAARGSNTTSFWRYDIANDTWDDAAVADAPQSIAGGSSSFFDGTHYIYVLKGNADDTFMRYDITTDSWEILANTDFGSPTDHILNTVTSGGDLAYDNSDTIYAIQGGNYSGFSSYSITANSWTTLPNLPAVSNAEGAQIEYDATSNAIYYIPANNKTFLFKYDISSSTWSQLEDAPATLSTSAAMRAVSGILYILRGGSTQNFYTYNIAKASWQVPNYGFFGSIFRGSDLRTFSTGSQIAKGQGENYYILRGANDSLFSKYNASTGTITRLSDIPSGVTTGASLTYDSVHNQFIALANSMSQRLFIYDVAGDYWYEDYQDVPPFVPAAGDVLKFDGTQYMYYLRGAGTTTFYKYDTAAALGSRWSSALASTPGGIGAGAEMIVKGNYIYLLRGNSQISFYRYDILGNSWSDPAVADLPAGMTVGADGFLVDGGDDSLYACRAINTSTCYQYSISGNSWTQIANAPANITAGGDVASNLSDKFYVIAGAGTNTFSDGLYNFVMQTTGSSFEESGSYESPSIAIPDVYKFANLSVSSTASSNATLKAYTRTSSDNSTWSSWSQATEGKTSGTTTAYKVNSPADSYIEVKFEFTSGDGVYSNVISSYSLTYYADSSAPSNASVLSAYTTATHSASMTTNNWYNYSSPEFTWPQAEGVGGATDTSTGSGVSGYYVYFGTDASADPATDGTLQTALSYTPSSLTSGSTYYLRIKTVDNAENVSSGVWQPFIYKYDNVAPENPTTVTADPPGYTATNSFDFAWSGATDSASLVTSYCYKTILNGAETCGVSDSFVNNVTAGGTGASTFYVRAVDAAGNKAPSYSSVSYYYSSTAPSAPQNLSVTPTSNTINEFAFSWTPPSLYFGAQANLLYYYSVNAIPTSSNVNSVGLSHTYLSSGAYATVPGANIMYVVAKDEAGNIDYSNYASVTFTADTSAPGIARNVDISDVSVKSTSNWRLAVSWDAPESSGSGVENYKVYRAASKTAVCSTDFTPFSYVASTTTESYVDTSLDQQDYAYCVKACDSTNNCSATSSTVTMLPDGKWTTAPTLTASPSAVVKTKSAVISWSTSRTSNSFVKYGTKSGDYGAEVGSSDQVAAHSITLSGLNPGTTYYYKVLWTDEDGNLGESEEQTLTTNAAPFILGVKVTNISLYSAYVSFTVKNASSISVNYGKTTSYGGIKTISTPTSESTQNILLDNLEEGTAYHLQVVGKDEEGNTFSGDDYSFQTLPVPKILDAKVQQVANMPTATLRAIWKSNTPISTIVTYYPTTNPELARDQISLKLTTVHESVLTNLKDDAQYTILIKGKDSAGNEAIATPEVVKTAVDFRPPDLLNVNVESTIVGVGQDAKAQVIISWDTDEPSTSQVVYAQGTDTSYGQSTQEDTNLSTNHVVTITNLTPSKIYHLQAVSKDKAGNVGKSFDTVVVTPKSTKAALNLVIENLSKTFGFLKGFSSSP